VQSEVRRVAVVGRPGKRERRVTCLPSWCAASSIVAAVSRPHVPLLTVLCVTAAAMLGVQAGSAKASPPTPANTAPECPVSSTSPFCVWPTEPPYDPSNPEGQAPWSAANYFENCAYWAAEKRPDIDQAAIGRYGYPLAPHGAWNWAPDAEHAGYSVTHTPAVGDIAVWPPEYEGASAGGHVSYVEAVEPEGAVVVSEMGFNGAGASQWLSASVAAGLSFISGSPAPALAPEPTPAPTLTPVTTPPTAALRPGSATVRATVHGGNLTLRLATTGVRSARASAFTGSRHSVLFRTVRRARGRMLLVARLAPAHWTVVVTFTPIAGFRAPRPRTIWLQVR
jgi:surface antigen